MKKVMAAMSGGVDSAVAANLLKEHGYDVTGVTMCLGVASVPGSKIKCCGPEEMEDARAVCRAVGIRHYILDFAGELESKVIRPFVDDYRSGLTPNPCVACNRHIKFGTLLNKALAMGFDYLATGHYASIKESSDGPGLFRAKDGRKDQTYFLYGIPKEALPNILFPLAYLEKTEVRRIAENKNLPVKNKPESQDVCFIPDGDTAGFLKERIGSEPGDIVNPEGRVIGRHKGISSYTIGQRYGLGISSSVPLYVISIDAKNNIITAGERKFLRAKGLEAEIMSIFAAGLPERMTAKIRYNSKPSPCSAEISGGMFNVVFDDYIEAITPGQSLVLYDGDRVLGGGIIRSATNRLEPSP